MSSYFDNFPKIQYDISKSGTTRTAVDVTLRYKIKTEIQNKTALYYNYIILDSDSPNIIADKFYGDVNLDWVVLMVNEIVDPFYDWPLNYYNFGNYITTKYGSVPEAQQGIHHYEQIVRAAGYDAVGDPLSEIIVEVDLETYTSLVATDRKVVTNYDYEQNLNEKKREILILDKDWLFKILSEVENIFV
jgi:hypothetical protein